MLHISSQLADDADRVSMRFEVANAGAREQADPSLAPQVVETDGGVVVFYEGENARSRALRFGFNGPVSMREIEEVERLFSERGIPVKFIINPYAGTGVPGLLGRRGYFVGSWMQVLVRRLTDTDLAREDREPGGQVCVKLIPPEEKQEWADTMAKGFSTLGIPYLMSPSMHLTVAQMAEAGCYTARSGDMIVGAASLLRFGRWAYLFTASTLEPFRNRGIQTAMIRRRLRDARRAGCEWALVLVQPDSGSHRNASRHGFQVAYTRATMKCDSR